eukprot:GHVQ01021048.1.p1 GENE.GHVQ01021048.1~~GHVQ01021048.1.p1  ORF type:complete len:856 (-),score=101.00 GHVQ01021048.1:141-2708(-)
MRDWWIEKVRNDCYNRGFTNSRGFGDLALPRNAEAMTYVSNLSTEPANKLQLYLQSSKGAAETGLSLLSPLYIMVIFGVCTLVMMCVSCCAFSKGFRRSVSDMSHGVFCRDCPRRDVGEMSDCRLGVIGSVYALFLMGGLAVFVYLIAVFSISYSNGTTATQCAISRGTYDMVYGMFWGGEEEFWPMWYGTQGTYDRASVTEWSAGTERDGYLSSIRTANDNMKVSLSADTQLYVGSADTTTPGSLSWAEEMYDLTSDVLLAEDSYQQNLYCVVGREMANAVKARLEMAFTDPWLALDYGIIHTASLAASGNQRVAKHIMTVMGQLNQSMYNFITTVDFNNIGNVTAWALIILSVIGFLSFALLTILLIIIVTKSVRKEHLPPVVANVAGCTWLCYAIYSIIVIVACGVALSWLSILSGSCSFVQGNLLSHNGWLDYPRLHSIIPEAYNITYECMSASSRGNWTEPLGINGLGVYNKRVTEVLQEKTSSYMWTYIYPNEAAPLFENANDFSWMYLIDSKLTAEAGETDRLHTYPEVLNSGIQWATIEAVINLSLIRSLMPATTLSEEGGGRLYGMGWIEDRVTQSAKLYAPNTAYTEWCIASNPNGCNPQTQIIINQLVDVSTDIRVLTVYAMIFRTNETEAEYWLNSVYWAAKKQRAVDSQLFPCVSRDAPSAITNCGLHEFSPYVESSTPSQEAAIDSNLLFQSALFAGSTDKYIDDSYQRTAVWEDVVIPATLELAQPLMSLQDQQCMVGMYQYMDIMTSTYCQSANPYLGFAIVFVCCLIAVAIIGWIFTFRIWHYLHDRNAMVRAMTKMQQAQGEVMDRRGVEVEAVIFDNEDIADLMEDLAGGEGEEGQ